MNPGDLVVCGVVTDVLLEDIRISVPKGHAVTIPADLALRSIDLHRQLSAGTIFQLNVNSLLSLKVRPEPDVPREEQQQVSQGRVPSQEALTLQAEVNRLQAEVSRLQTENADLRAFNEKINARFDEVVGMLRHQQPSSSSAQKALVSSLREEEGNVPLYIPAQIRPEVDALRIETQEKTSESAGVNQAAGALKRFKRQLGTGGSGTGDQ